MPVNEFEKQVQQKMEELQLRPSAEVWQEVEKRIRKEKKRRRFIIWVFLFGLLLPGGAGWWIVDGNNKQSTNLNPITKIITEYKKINETQPDTRSEMKKKSVSAEKQKGSNGKNENIEIVPGSSSVIVRKEAAPDKKIVVTVVKKIPFKREADIIATLSVIIENKNIKPNKITLPDTVKQNQLVNIQENNRINGAIRTESIVGTDSSTTNTKNSITFEKNIVTYDLADTTQKIITVLKDSLIAKQTESVSKKDDSKIKINKWEFGITGMVGSSNKSDAISIFGMEKNFDAASPVNSIGSAGQLADVPPAKPSNGFSWQAGFYVKRKLTARTALSTGLNFSSYSTMQLTGIFVDSARVYSNERYSSSVSNFYRNGAGGVHNNHYNYLTLPISLHWQINKGVKLPLVFHNGLSMGFFTGSNALVYNSGSSVFYEDNKSFNKIQFSYQSGLYARLFNRTKHPLTAGVLFNYQFSKLQKVNINGGNHLSSFGLQAGWLLKK